MCDEQFADQSLLCIQTCDRRARPAVECFRSHAWREVGISCGSSSTSGVNRLQLQVPKERCPAESDTSPKSDVRDDAALKPCIQRARGDAQHGRDFGFGEELGFRGKLASGLRVIGSHATGRQSTAPTCACVKIGRNWPELSGNAESASQLRVNLCPRYIQRGSQLLARNKCAVFPFSRRRRHRHDDIRRVLAGRQDSEPLRRLFVVD